jgi:Glyoxalase-like domain
MSPIIDLAAVVVDCAQAAPMAAFYQAVCGGEFIRNDADSVWLEVSGITVIFREVAGYQAPTWPCSDVPMQIHLDFFVDDLDKAEALLHQHGATTPEFQPHRENGLVVMLDPAGHPFCIGTRVQQP